MSTLRIALAGMYGGMSRGYNPGCFLIGYVTRRALLSRVPGHL
jgi:hypothetical protein